ILLCVFLPSVASLLLPVSNLTNLLLAAHVPAARFAAFSGLPQLAVLFGLWAGIRLACREELVPRLNTAALPAPSKVIVDRPVFLAACGLLALPVRACAGGHAR